MQKENAELDTQLLAMDDQKDVIFQRKCQLLVLNGPNKGKKIDLSKPRVEIGRRETNDLESDNGTFINDVRVKEAYLPPGDVIRIGNTQVEFIAFDEKVQIEPSSYQ